MPVMSTAAELNKSLSMRNLQGKSRIEQKNPTMQIIRDTGEDEEKRERVFLPSSE